MDRGGNVWLSLREARRERGDTWIKERMNEEGGNEWVSEGVELSELVTDCRSNGWWLRSDSVGC
jgi:hypothetical protein